MEWIARHFVGWEFLVPGILVGAVALSATLRSRRPELVPWAALLPWAAVVVACYVAFDIDRQWYSARVFWAAMTFTLAFVAALPYGAMLFFLRRPRVTQWSGGRAASGAALLGVVMIPVGTLVSGWLADLLIPLVLPSP